jgi:hypothetical protein
MLVFSEAGAALTNEANKVNQTAQNAVDHINNAALDVNKTDTNIHAAHSAAKALHTALASNVAEVDDAFKAKYHSEVSFSHWQEELNSAYSKDATAVSSFWATQTLVPAAEVSQYVNTTETAYEGTKNATSSAYNNAQAAGNADNSKSGKSGASMVGVSCTGLLGVVGIVITLFVL